MADLFVRMLRALYVRPNSEISIILLKKKKKKKKKRADLFYYEIYIGLIQRVEKKNF